MNLNWVKSKFGLIALVSLTAAGAFARNVYVLSSGDVFTDNGVLNALSAHGHNATLGSPFSVFTSESLTGQEVVYLQANWNWTAGNMPIQGQERIRAFVAGGGGLVTSEWVLWKMAATTEFQLLTPMTAAVPTGSYDSSPVPTLRQGTPNAVINLRLPLQFALPLDSYSGTRSRMEILRPGATLFYKMEGFLALAGRPYARGRVANFATTNGPSQLSSIEGRQLLSNVVEWACLGSPDQAWRVGP